MAGGDTQMLRNAHEMLRTVRRRLVGARRQVVLAADFSARGEISYRLAGEIRYLSEAGATVSLVQTRKPAPGDTIAPEIQTCVRRDQARRLSADDAIRCDVLVLHRPSAANDVEDLLRRVDRPELFVICHSAEDVTVAKGLGLHHTQASVFVTHTLAMHSDVDEIIEKKPWTPAVDRHAAIDWSHATGRKIAIGWFGKSEWPKSGGSDFRKTLGGDIEHHWIGGADAPDFPDLERLSLDRLVRGIDVFAIAPDCGLDPLPDAIVAAALCAGRPVVLPVHLEEHYGSGPIYYGNAGFDRSLQGAIATAGAPHRTRPGRGRASFVARCGKGPITRLGSARAWWTGRQSRPDERPVLFLPSNGVGVGHLTRLLAIARRTCRNAVFASQAPALQMIRDFGFAAEYIPSHAAIGGDFETWDSWYCTEIGRIADRYDPALVVYDGNHLSPGLIHAVASRRDCRLAWVRRGMWARTASRFLANARWCDLIIEPGELAGERDDGATSLLRHEAQIVDPIRLLEPEELPDRRAAAQALQLDPGRPACLVQLGSGYNRDLLSLLDLIIEELRKQPGLQIAVAEWVSGSVPLNLWPDVTVLRGFPVNQYIRAFDFCISAAGYNSFHEMIGYCVPTIFVANRSPTMDDQYGRAKFAQDNAAAFEISEAEMGEFPDLVAMIMQGKAREFLASHCAKLARPNGAAAAADALVRVAASAEVRH